VLTCKSFVKPGYRGERPIEPPSSWFRPKGPSGSLSSCESVMSGRDNDESFWGLRPLGYRQTPNRQSALVFSVDRGANEVDKWAIPGKQYWR